MMKLIYGYCAAPVMCAVALLATACGSDSQPPGGSGGVTSSASAGGSGSNLGASGGGSSTAGTAGASLGSGGSQPGDGGGTATSGGTAAVGSGGSISGAGGGNTASGGTGGPASGGNGGATTGAGGTGTGSGGARMVELIGAGPATCGTTNTNATHGDGFVCVLNYPSVGPNVVGYWFDYAFVASTCNVAMTKPSGNKDPNPKVCFSGACPATSGGGLGLALCDVHGIDVSKWPQLEALETASSLSNTLKSPFAGCNPGATLTGVSWTLGSGSIPTGMSVLFDDAADKTVARVDVAAAATSVEVPPNVDASKVASIKFSTSGASSPSWNFCLTSVKVSMR